MVVGCREKAYILYMLSITGGKEMVAVKRGFTVVLLDAIESPAPISASNLQSEVIAAHPEAIRCSFSHI